MKWVLAGVWAGFSVMGTQADAAPGVYAKNCQICHQSGGVGAKGQYPRLAGRLGKLAGSDRGRAYLIEVVLAGLSGKVTVDGSAIFGFMPPQSRLSDADVAAVLNEVVALGTGTKGGFAAAEVARQRVKKRLAAPALRAEREALIAAGQLQ